ncbi:hypothetical protein U9M48_035529 [Paspalum notatum var. saurae]|uniref:Uncharacterized protein n=1 Tax=Paspalum notatum var. saurae TaxID=547442 RepID=A0AAQ3UBD0_PASNO
MRKPLGRDLPGSITRLARPGTPRDQTRGGSPMEDLEHNGDTSRALHSHNSKEEEPSMDLGQHHTRQDHLPLHALQETR